MASGRNPTSDAAGTLSFFRVEPGEDVNGWLPGTKKAQDCLLRETTD